MAKTQESNTKQDKQGEKRVWEQSPNKQRPGKRRRQTSPEPTSGPPQWMEPPTFLTAEERETKNKETELVNKSSPSKSLEAPNQSPKAVGTKHNLEPKHQKSSKTPIRTSVRERIREINNKSASPGKFPELKQTKMIQFIKRKSPKALKARERLEKSSETETKPSTQQGALKSPLSGDSDYPGPQLQTSGGPGPAPVERGGVWDGGGRKKALKVLEKLPLDLKASPGGLGKRRPKKRLQDTQGGKDLKTRRTESEGRKQNTLEKWIKKGTEGPGDPPPDLGEDGSGPNGKRTNWKEE